MVKDISVKKHDVGIVRAEPPDARSNYNSIPESQKVTIRDQCRRISTEGVNPVNVETPENERLFNLREVFRKYTEPEKDGKMYRVENERRQTRKRDEKRKRESAEGRQEIGLYGKGAYQ